MLTRIFTVFVFLTLGGCGVSYISPSVSDKGDVDVRIVTLTAETVLEANQSPYTPRGMPDVFFQTAGSSATAQGPDTAPDPIPDPSLEPEIRPTALETRAPRPFEPEPYRIGIGDVVVLAVKSARGTVAELAGLLAAQNERLGYTVQDDGTISIPNVGRVRLDGLTLEEAEAELFQRLVENGIDPAFSLEIADFNSKSVSIGGAVARPQVVPITLVPLYLDRALAEAGGISSRNPDYTTIRIYRNGTLYRIPLPEYLSQGELQKTQLKDGDSIFVDTEYELEKAQTYFQEQIRLSEYRQRSRNQALNELRAEIDLHRTELREARDNYRFLVEFDAAERDYVYVTGEVDRPGRFRLPLGRTANLADALYDEGGFSIETGNAMRIYVLRASWEPPDPGAVTAWHLDASNAVNLTLATRMEMRPNDVIFVAEQPVTRWNRVISQISPSLITFAVNRVTN